MAYLLFYEKHKCQTSTVRFHGFAPNRLSWCVSASVGVLQGSQDRIGRWLLCPLVTNSLSLCMIFFHHPSHAARVILNIAAFETTATGSCCADVYLSPTQRNTVCFIRPVRFPRQERMLFFYAKTCLSARPHAPERRVGRECSKQAGLCEERQELKRKAGFIAPSSSSVSC